VLSASAHNYIREATRAPSRDSPVDPDSLNGFAQTRQSRQTRQGRHRLLMATGHQGNLDTNPVRAVLVNQLLQLGEIGVAQLRLLNLDTHKPLGPCRHELGPRVGQRPAFCEHIPLPIGKRQGGGARFIKACTATICLPTGPVLPASYLA
jgi:hypothetical protein